MSGAHIYCTDYGYGGIEVDYRHSYPYISDEDAELFCGADAREMDDGARFVTLTVACALPRTDSLCADCVAEADRTELAEPYAGNWMQAI